MYLTTAEDEPQGQFLLAFDAADGSALWKVPVSSGVFMAKHPKNTHASSTPVCDGQAIYAAFAADDEINVVAVNKDGTLRWRRAAGPYVSNYGYAASLSRYENLVIVSAESRGAKLARITAVSFVSAMNCDTGDIVWRVRLPEQHAYGSPVIARIGGIDQLLINSEGRVSSHDPRTGNVIWECKTESRETANSVAFDDESVYVANSYPDSRILSIRADGHGDVTNTHVNWTAKRFAGRVPTPLVHNQRLYVLHDNGILRCMNAADGQMVWQKRLAGDFTASPLIVNDLLYAFGESGVSYVMPIDGDEAPDAIESDLGEAIFATPAVWKDSLIIRSERKLWRVANERLADQ